MRKQKSEESRRTLNVLVGLAVAISLFPLAAHFQFRGGNQLTWLLVLQAVPFVAMEFIFIYYFRLTYARYKSFEAQKLQLDHRIALLQFIQRYATFRDGKQGLGKFEELIFSGIVASEEAIPSMFDGIDHLARLIGAARGSAKAGNS